MLSLTSNLDYRSMPGCIFIATGASGSPTDSVAQATRLRTIDESRIGDLAGHLEDATISRIDDALRHVLSW